MHPKKNCCIIFLGGWKNSSFFDNILSADPNDIVIFNIGINLLLASLMIIFCFKNFWFSVLNLIMNISNNSDDEHHENHYGYDNPAS